MPDKTTVAGELPVVARITPDLAETCCEWWWQHNAREVDQDRFTKKLVLHSDATAALAQKEGEIERVERNRDMWKDQCARQAERLEKAHAALALIAGKKRPSTDGVSDSGQASDLSMMVMTMKEIARAALGSQA